VTDSSQLDVLVRTVRAAGPPPPDPGSLLATELAAAVDRWRAPIRVQVTGRAGVGKSALVAALNLPADAETPAIDDPARDHDPLLDADVVVYLLAAAPTRADQAVLAATPGAVAVLNKVDTLSGSWSAETAARRGAAEFGAPILPLVASLAARTGDTALTDVEASSLRRLAGVADHTLTLSPELFLVTHSDTDVRARRTMLQRWDLYGIDCALTALRADQGLSAATLTLILHAASGVDAVAAAVTARVQSAAALRAGALLDAIARLAARSLPAAAMLPGDGRAVRGDVRAELETFLRGDLAARLGLAAGLACPDVAEVAAEYPTTHPRDPHDALRRADRWRAVAAAPATSFAGRRAANRVHQGYLRMWERMSVDARG
jgi:hypothetical protein